MSILIKGMEMPYSCASCLWEFQNHCCLINERVESCDRDPNCPLIEVPTPHGRLIDADELREKMLNEADEYFNEHIRHGYHNCELLVDDAPTVIESEL